MKKKRDEKEERSKQQSLNPLSNLVEKQGKSTYHKAMTKNHQQLEKNILQSKYKNNPSTYTKCKKVTIIHDKNKVTMHRW